MANSRSARKRIRASERKHERNRAVRSAVRTKVAKARRALLGGDDRLEATTQLTVAITALDRAAEKGILHANNAARRKSRLMALANKLEAAATGGEEAQLAARAAAAGGQKGRRAVASRSRGAAPSAETPAATRKARAPRAVATKAAAGTTEAAATGSAPAKASAGKATTAVEAAPAKPARTRRAAKPG